MKYSRKQFIEKLIEHEGCVLTVYQDSLGIDTIGYGFAIKDLFLNKDICDTILERKLKDLKDKIDSKFDWYKYMPQEIKDIVVEMCYQLGVYGFSCFKKTIAYLQDKQWEEASVEMLDSRWAEQTPHRARELSNRVKEVTSGV